MFGTFSFYTHLYIINRIREFINTLILALFTNYIYMKIRTHPHGS